jgi:hypothetical protein
MEKQAIEMIDDGPDEDTLVITLRAVWLLGRGPRAGGRDPGCA